LKGDAAITRPAPLQGTAIIANRCSTSIIESL